MVPEKQVPFSQAELEIVKKIANRDGLTEDEAASKLFSKALSRKVRRKTGKPPAQIYPIKRR